MDLIRRLARTAEFDEDTMRVSPSVQHFAGELGPVIHMQQTRLMSLFTQSFKHRNDAITRE